MLVLAIGGVSLPTAAAAHRAQPVPRPPVNVPSHAPMDVAAAIERLDAALNLGSFDGEWIGSYSDGAVEALGDALRQRSDDLKWAALVRLKWLLAGIEVPPPVLARSVRPAIDQLARSVAGDPNRRRIFDGSIQEALWLVGYRELLSDDDRLRYLKGGLETRRQRIGPAFDATAREHLAVALLRQFDRADARTVLQETLRDEQAGRVDRAFALEVEHAIQRVEVRQALARLKTEIAGADEDREIETITGFLVHRRGAPVADPWPIARLAALARPAAVDAIRETWKDPVANRAYRLQAQEILMQLQIIRPQESGFMLSRTDAD